MTLRDLKVGTVGGKDGGHGDGLDSWAGRHCGS